MRLTVRGGHLIPLVARCPPMRYWLMKSEPSECSIDDAAAAPSADRALGRRAQLPGAQLHAQRHARPATACCSITRRAPSPASPASPKSRRRAYPDATQFDPKSHYFDAKSRARGAALVSRRREAGEEDAPAVAGRDARDAGARDDARPAARQPPVDHAGERRRMERADALARRGLSWRRAWPALWAPAESPRNNPRASTGGRRQGSVGTT